MPDVIQRGKAWSGRAKQECHCPVTFLRDGEKSACQAMSERTCRACRGTSHFQVQGLSGGDVDSVRQWRDHQTQTIAKVLISIREHSVGNSNHRSVPLSPQTHKEVVCPQTMQRAVARCPPRVRQPGHNGQVVRGPWCDLWDGWAGMHGFVNRHDTHRWSVHRWSVPAGAASTATAIGRQWGS